MAKKTTPYQVSYVNIKGDRVDVNLPEDVWKMQIQLQKDYDASYRFIRSQWYYQWKYAIKSYHLSTFDRKKSGIKDWQQNISIGIIRSFIDVFISNVNEKPLTFIGTPVNQQGLDNKEAIIKTLNYVSDVTGFHKTIKKCLSNGLITGTFAIRVGYMKNSKNRKATVLVDGMPVEMMYQDEPQDYPYATPVDIFNIFPDMGTGPMRYVTERIVMSHDKFLDTFGSLINSKLNKSPLKDPEFIRAIPMPENRNGASVYDFGIIKQQINEKINEELRAKDKFSSQRGTGNDEYNSTTSNLQDEDSDITDGLMEVLYYVRKEYIVLSVNGYPVYVGKNPFGFVPYIVQPASESDTRFGEGIPYLLRGIEDVANSFVNNYFDGARALATPTFIAQKNLFVNDRQLEDGKPGGVIYFDGPVGEAIQRLDKGGLNDFNIMPIINNIATTLTGVSEYAMGQSAKERTAQGALAVTQSSNRRISPFMSRFVDCVSIVAKMWLELIRQNWIEDKFIYILDEQGNSAFEAINNKQLLGGMNISLQAEGLMGATNEMDMQKLITMYQTLAPSGIINSSEMAAEILKKANLTPSRFIVNQNVTIPQDKLAPEEPTPMPEEESAQIAEEEQAPALSDILKRINSPQIDLGNGGEGQQ